ncbi:MAG: SHOCT domain-containing protein [Opitutus sp.]
MKNPVRRTFISFACFGLALLACGAKSALIDPVVPLGENTFSITRQASSGFSRDTEQLKADVREEATAYCAAQGKQLKIESLTAKKPMFALGYASAKIVFKALDPNAPELVAAAPAASEKPTSTGGLYNDLLKLDELRKRGILNEEEFQSEKKKVLNRSQ